MSAGKENRGLEGRAVFLSASVPDPRRESEYRVADQPGAVYVRVEDAHVEIERAVVSLARAVFSNRGRLVFGGHPSISPLVAMVAGEYRAPVPAGSVVEAGAGTPPEAAGEEPPLAWIYQSRAFEDVVPADTWLLQRYGYAHIRWTPAVDGERYSAELRGQPQCPRSLELMRRTMLRDTDPVAMVAIGGMKGVRDEVEIFREMYPQQRVYVIASTGGAAGWLAQNRSALDVIDRRILARLRDVRRPSAAGPRPDERPPEAEATSYRFTPYPLIMQELADELTGKAERRRPRP